MVVYVPRISFPTTQVLESMDREEHTERLARRAWALSAMDDEQRRRGSQEVKAYLIFIRLVLPIPLGVSRLSKALLCTRLVDFVCIHSKRNLNLDSIKTSRRYNVNLAGPLSTIEIPQGEDTQAYG